MMGNTTNNKSSPFWERKAALDKAVNEVFDDLISELSARPKLHSSEQFNRMSHREINQNNAKPYDFINPYHGYCRLCEQHFYTRSIPEDINSFFQKHINTPYHRQLRKFESYPEDMPILTWEEPQHSARCNICEISGLDAFIIKTKFCIKKLMHQHVCIWSCQERDTNDKFIRKLSLLKKYSGLKVFEQKFLKAIDGNVVCFLCGVSLTLSEDKALCHLRSDLHYQKLCMFIWLNFGFAPKDILNGYNLEIVTRWLLLYEPPLWNKLVEHNEMPACVNDTNNFVNPYPEDRQNMSYSPAYLGMLLQDDELDFVFRDKCLLCGVEMVRGHFSTAMHRKKTLDPSNDKFTPENCMIYLENRERRLKPYSKIIHRYERLRYNQKGDKMYLPVSSHYIKWLFAKKLPLVEKAVVAVNDKEMFCHVCDEYLDKSSREAHLSSFGHSSHIEKWGRLRKDSESDRFLESFKIAKHVVVCLLCGTLIHTNSFFAHLKSATHTLRLGLCISLNLGVPVSSTLEFRDDHTCCCTVCDSLLGTRNSFKATLNSIKDHWPCPRFEEAERIGISLNEDQFLNLDESEEGSEQSKDSPQHCRGCPDRQFMKVAENAGKAMGQEEAGNTLGNSPYSNNRVQNKKFDYRRAKKNASQANCMESAKKGPPRGGIKGTAPPTPKNPTSTTSVSSTGHEDSGVSVGDEKEATSNDGPRTNSTEDNTSEREEEEDEKEEDKEEVLLIKDMPKKKRKRRLIYSKFQSFGNIRYVFFYNKAAVVAFVERGVADVAATRASKILDARNVKVEVTERKLVKMKLATEEKVEEMVMPKDMIELLENPQKLVKFVRNMNLQAMGIRRSGEDKKKEEIVCNMVIRAIMDRYPRARCYPFGSRLTEVSLSTSDLDVFIDCGGAYDGSKNTNPGAEKRLVRTMADIIRKVKDVTDLTVIDRARVPILSFYHKPTATHCDLSFKNGLGVQNSLLIKFLVGLDWRVRPVILFMKHWAREVGLHGPPYFSSYALSMLVINYLEQLDPPVIPTIETLQDSYVGRRLTVGGWDCSINTNRANYTNLTNKDTLLALILGFFEFYENFDFSKNVVFPVTGKPLPREVFSESGRDRLPLCFKRSILNLPIPLENLVSAKFPICIIDPFDLSHVLTKSLNQEGLKQFMHFCQMTRQYLKKGMADSLPRP